jgi:hypothetical protein
MKHADAANDSPEVPATVAVLAADLARRRRARRDRLSPDECRALARLGAATEPLTSQLA